MYKEQTRLRVVVTSCLQYLEEEHYVLCTCLPFALSMMTVSLVWQALLMHKLFEQSFGPLQTREE